MFKSSLSYYYLRRHLGELFPNPKGFPNGSRKANSSLSYYYFRSHLGSTGLKVQAR